MVGRRRWKGVLNMSGGLLTVSGNPISIGSLGAAFAPGTFDGLVNLSGGTLISISKYVYRRTVQRRDERLGHRPLDRWRDATFVGRQ